MPFFQHLYYIVMSVAWQLLSNFPYEPGTSGDSPAATNSSRRFLNTSNSSMGLRSSLPPGELAPLTVKPDLEKILAIAEQRTRLVSGHREHYAA